jgi:predicted  nucleic acid-binding Zn-ribbon protein
MLLEDRGLTGSDDIRLRLNRLQKDLESIKKGRENAQEQLTDISDTLERLQSGQTKHKQELDEEQKRQDGKKRKTQSP